MWRPTGAEGSEPLKLKGHILSNDPLLNRKQLKRSPSFSSDREADEMNKGSDGAEEVIICGSRSG